MVCESARDIVEQKRKKKSRENWTQATEKMEKNERYP